MVEDVALSTKARRASMASCVCRCLKCERPWLSSIFAGSNRQERLCERFPDTGGTWWDGNGELQKPSRVCRSSQSGFHPPRQQWPCRPASFPGCTASLSLHPSPVLFRSLIVSLDFAGILKVSECGRMSRMISQNFQSEVCGPA